MMELFHLHFQVKRGGNLINMGGGGLHSKKKTSGGGYYQSLYVVFALEWDRVGISKVSIVSKSILPSSKLLVQAKTKKKLKKKIEMYSRGVTTNGILFFSQKVGVPSLPVVLLFGKNGW